MRDISPSNSAVRQGCQRAAYGRRAPPASIGPAHAPKPVSGSPMAGESRPPRSPSVQRQARQRVAYGRRAPSASIALGPAPSPSAGLLWLSRAMR
jgi:hypothetical protein